MAAEAGKLSSTRGLFEEMKGKYTPDEFCYAALLNCYRHTHRVSAAAPRRPHPVLPPHPRSGRQRGGRRVYWGWGRAGGQARWVDKRKDRAKERANMSDHKENAGHASRGCTLAGQCHQHSPPQAQSPPAPTPTPRKCACCQPLSDLLPHAHLILGRIQGPHGPHPHPRPRPRPHALLVPDLCWSR